MHNHTQSAQQNMNKYDLKTVDILTMACDSEYFQLCFAIFLANPSQVISFSPKGQPIIPSLPSFFPFLHRYSITTPFGKRFT